MTVASLSPATRESINPLAPPDALRRELLARRAALLERLAEGDVLVLASAPVFPRNNTVEHPYRQDSDFYYLSGHEEPDSVLVLSRILGAATFTLFVPARDPERETWDGPRSGVEGAIRDFGADAAYPSSELATRLPGLLENARRLHCALGRDAKFDAMLLHARDHLRRRQRLGGLAPTVIVDVSETLHAMRAIKSPFEIDTMRRACLVTQEAHEAALAVARPGAFEHEVEAEMLRIFRRHGSPRPAYEPIVGSGPNATILHYRKNDRRLEDGDLLLIDAGAEVGLLASDVTRTFPVSGTFNRAQRNVYEAVLRAQEVAIAAVRPGASIESVHEATLRSLTESLIELGLVEGPLEQAIEEGRFKKYYMHRTSHWLGMDVHDVGAYFEHRVGEAKPVARPLAKGMVLTIEPGLYFGRNSGAPDAYLGIGVRIEDDVLVTEQGCEVLTAAIPKSVEAIEKLLAARNLNTTPRMGSSTPLGSGAESSRA